MKSVSLALALILVSLHSTRADEPQEVVASVVEAANELMATLNDDQQKQVMFDFDDNKQRMNWSNLPEGSVQRQGLRWGDLNEEQRQAIKHLIGLTMSERGLQQVIDNMDGDQTLVREGGPRFGRDYYFFSILGKPSETEPWMWQFGGHHLAINATIVKDQITLSPSLTGGQPMDFEIDGRKVRQLAKEKAVAFKLIETLSAEEKETAILSDRAASLIWGPGKEGAKPMEQGINAMKLDVAQRDLLLELIEARIGILNETHTAIAMNEIKGNLDKTWFAWFGPTEAGGAGSYRIQGPTVLIEYTPQQLGGDPPNHIHAMYRNPVNDYGVGLIRPNN